MATMKVTETLNAAEMPRRAGTRYRFALFALISTWCIQAGAFGVGYTQTEVAAGKGLSYGLWYPSDAAPDMKRLGPFDVNYANNGKPAATKTGLFPLVVLSHGNSGRFRNHHLTAAALAAQGMVVVAPQHTQDHRIDGEQAIAAMLSRVDEVKAALAAARGNATLQSSIDAQKTYAIGYSLGGATVLAAAGAEFDLDLADAHCAKRGAADPDYCNAVPWWARWLERVQSIFSNQPKPPKQSNFAPTSVRFDKVALVAPLGQGLTPQSLGAIQSKVLLLPIQGDHILRAPFHSEYLRDALKGSQVQFNSKLVGHHFGFITPFPKWLTDQETIPIAMDPPGFDRAAFISEANRSIANFFLNP
jgi:predicted dienelactone hydrolase